MEYIIKSKKKQEIEHVLSALCLQSLKSRMERYERIVEMDLKRDFEECSSHVSDLSSSLEKLDICP